MSDDGREQLEAQLSAYLDGELTAAERAEVEAFLIADPQAQRLLEDLRATAEAVHSLPRATASQDLMDAIRTRLERRALLDETPSQQARAARAASFGTRWVAAAAIVLMTSVAGYVMWSFRDEPETASPKHDELAWNDQGALSTRDHIEPLDRIEDENMKKGMPQGAVAGAAIDAAADSKSRLLFETGRESRTVEDLNESLDGIAERGLAKAAPARPSAGVASGNFLAATEKPPTTEDKDTATDKADVTELTQLFGGRPAATAAPPTVPLTVHSSIESLHDDQSATNASAVAKAMPEPSGAPQEGAATEFYSAYARPTAEPATSADLHLGRDAEGEERPSQQVVELVYADAARQREAVEILQTEFNFRFAETSEHDEWGLSDRANEEHGQPVARRRMDLGVPPDVSYGYKVDHRLSLSAPSDEQSRHARGRYAPPAQTSPAAETPGSHEQQVAVNLNDNGNAAVTESLSRSQHLGESHFDSALSDGRLTQDGQMGDHLWSMPTDGPTLMEISLPSHQSIVNVLTNIEQSRAGDATIRWLDRLPGSDATATALGEQKFARLKEEDSPEGWWYDYAHETLGKLKERLAGVEESASQPASAQESADATKGFDLGQRQSGESDGDGTDDTRAGRLLGFGAGGAGREFRTGGSFAGGGFGGGGGGGGISAGDPGQPSSLSAVQEPTTQPAQTWGRFEALTPPLLAGEPPQPHVIRLYFWLEPPATQPAATASQPAAGDQ